MGDVAYTVCEATAKEILGVELARERGCGKLKVEGGFSYKEHNTASALNEVVGNVSECDARGGDAVDKEDLFAIFGAKLVDSY